MCLCVGVSWPSCPATSVPEAFFGGEAGVVAGGSGVLFGFGDAGGRRVVLGAYEVPGRSRVECVCMQPPFDGAALVVLGHAAMTAQHVAQAGVDRTLGLVGGGGDAQVGVGGLEVGEQVPGLGESGQQPVGAAQPVVGVPPSLTGPQPRRCPALVTLLAEVGPLAGEVPIDAP